MRITAVIKILEEHNKWRRGKTSAMQNPAQLGKAIDAAIRQLKKLPKK